MKNTSYDKLAIGLSLLCTLHCLAVPLAVLALPSISTLFLADESIHFYMALMVIPVSGFALFIGYKQHGDISVLLLGFSGLVVLLFSVILGHDWLGELVEKILTLLGSGFICYAHYLNYQSCQTNEDCQCHSGVLKLEKSEHEI